MDVLPWRRLGICIAAFCGSGASQALADGNRPALRLPVLLGPPVNDDVSALVQFSVNVQHPEPSTLDEVRSYPDSLDQPGSPRPELVDDAAQGYQREVNSTTRGTVGITIEMAAWKEYAYLTGIAEQAGIIRKAIASMEGLLWSSTHSTGTRTHLTAFEYTFMELLSEHTQDWLNITQMFRDAASAIIGGLQVTGQYEEAAHVAKALGKSLPHADKYVTSLARMERLLDSMGTLDKDQQLSRLQAIIDELQQGMEELNTFGDTFIEAHQALKSNIEESKTVATLPNWSAKRISSAFGKLEAKAVTAIRSLQKATTELANTIQDAQTGSDFSVELTTPEPEREMSWDDASKIFPLPVHAHGSD
mmetsp:Transcript_52340/g.167874  ORF Transcript_52340/g.167874 Transcript_52340/m.167874 type:complete len:362 (-) Transcript_52340:39-1124(-)